MRKNLGSHVVEKIGSWLGVMRRSGRRRAKLSSTPVSALEARIVPSALLTGGVLHVSGGSRSDTVVVSLVSGNPETLDVSENGRHSQFNLNQVHSIQANLRAGNDLFQIDQGNGQILLPAVVLGGDGNDTLVGGGVADTLDGQAGDDVLRGQAGDDSLLGGLGKDNLDGGKGHDRLLGEAGDDELDGELGDDIVNGGDGNDTVKGGEGADLVTGGLGNDTFDAVDGISELIDRGNGEDSREVPLADAPRRVRTAANRLLAGTPLTSLNLVFSGSQAYFDLEWTANGLDRSAQMSSKGTLVEETQQIDPISLPLAVIAAVTNGQRTNRILGAALLTAGGNSQYELVVKTSRGQREMLLSETGQILDDHAIPRTKAVVPTAPFRDFSASGTTEFMNLNPGTVLTLEGVIDTGETERLVITVLDAVKFVDGVETRVVEERAFLNGELIEVAKNYFAIDKVTGNLYYFGEDVDNYRHGTIVNHNGSWESGVQGAKFGLLLPGSPRAGFAFIEENAPGIAQDRGRIVSRTLSVSTGVGDFSHVVQVEETSPLDDTLDNKYYAPGIGLVQSNELILINYTLA